MKNIEKKTTFLYKFLLILTAILLILTGIISTLFDNSDLALVFFFAMIIVYILFLILQAKGGEYIELRKKTQSLKIKIKKFKYTDVLKTFKENLNYNSEYLKISNELSGYIFYKYSRPYYLYFRKKISLIVLIDMKEFDEANLKLSLNKIDEWIENKYGKYNISDYIELILVTHIENRNNEFFEYINKDILQMPYFIKLPVGIIENEKLMYISKQENIAQVWRYNKLKKTYIKVCKSIIKK